jgi:hypothetical protein
MKSRILSSLGFFVFLTFLLAEPLAAQKDFLKYKLTATPAKVVVNRMPPIPCYQIHGVLCVYRLESDSN